MKTYVFDIDGTICTNSQGVYTNAKPILDRIAIVNKLYDEGNYIKLFTSRYMGRFNEDVKKAKKSIGAWELCSGYCGGTSSTDSYFEYTSTTRLQLDIDQAHRCVGFIERGRNSKCKPGYPGNPNVAVELTELAF